MVKINVFLVRLSRFIKVFSPLKLVWQDIFFRAYDLRYPVLLSTPYNSETTSNQGEIQQIELIFELL